MNKFLWLLISVLSFLASAYALEVAPNTTDELLKFLDAQPVPVGFFEQHKDAVFIEPALAVLLRPRLYPDNAAIFTQAVFGFDRKVNLFRRDERVELRAVIADAQAKLAAYEAIDQGRKPPLIPFTTDKDVERDIYETIKNSPQIHKFENDGERDALREEKQKILLDVVRQHTIKPTSAGDREAAKDLEILTAKQIIRSKYGIDVEGSAPAYVFSFYGKLDTSKNICQTVNQFLQSRGLTERIIYHNTPIDLKTLKKHLEQKEIVVIALRGIKTTTMNVCLLGYASTGARDCFFVALLPQGEGDFNSSVVLKNTDKWLYQVDWHKLRDNIIGYYTFIIEGE